MPANSWLGSCERENQTIYSYFYQSSSLHYKLFYLWERTCEWGGWCKEILLAVIIPLIESAGQDRASILRDLRKLADWKGAMRQSSLGVHLQISSWRLEAHYCICIFYCSPGSVLSPSIKYLFLLFVQRRKNSVIDHFNIIRKKKSTLNPSEGMSPLDVSKIPIIISISSDTKYFCFWYEWS